MAPEVELTGADNRVLQQLRFLDQPAELSAEHRVMQFEVGVARWFHDPPEAAEAFGCRPFGAAPPHHLVDQLRLGKT